MEQIKQFEPGFTLGERLKLSKTRGWDFIVTSNKGTQFTLQLLQLREV
jgi:thioredoxin reductase (NADPH)